VEKGLKLPCLFMITELSIRCQKNLEVGIPPIHHWTPLARQPISCYYYACDLSCFDVVLCPFSSRILATNAQISLSRKPRPPQCSLGFPKSPPLKNSRSANVNNTTLYVSVGSFIISWFVLTLHLTSLAPASLFLHRKNPTIHQKRLLVTTNVIYSYMASY